MIHMKNIHRYEPVDPFLGDAYYFKDDAGHDWYKMEPYWSPDTLKVAYLPGGAITAVVQDQTGLNPEGVSIVELDPEDVPEACTHPFHGWVYIDGIVGKLNAQYEIEARDVRDAFLKATDVLYVPDYTIGDQPLTQGQVDELKAVRQGLKMWPKTLGWPFVPFPVVPDWLLREAIKHGFEEMK